MVQHGLLRQPSEPLGHWLQRVLAEPVMAQVRTPLQHLLRLHYRYRFDPQGLTLADREHLRREAKACLATLNGARPAGGRGG